MGVSGIISESNTYVNFNEVMAVSYTHLDVYKRQGMLLEIYTEIYCCNEELTVSTAWLSFGKCKPNPKFQHFYLIKLLILNNILPPANKKLQQSLRAVETEERFDRVSSRTHPKLKLRIGLFWTDCSRTFWGDRSTDLLLINNINTLRAEVKRREASVHHKKRDEYEWLKWVYLLLV